MPFVVPDAVTWLADWDAGLPVPFENSLGEETGKTFAEQAEGAAEVLRALIQLDPDPDGWKTRELWQSATNSLRNDLRQTFRQWPVPAIAWAVDVGMTIYAEGVGTMDPDNLIQVQQGA